MRWKRKPEPEPETALCIERSAAGHVIRTSRGRTWVLPTGCPDWRSADTGEWADRELDRWLDTALVLAEHEGRVALIDMMEQRKDTP